MNKPMIYGMCVYGSDFCSLVVIDMVIMNRPPNRKEWLAAKKLLD